jgi:membrane-associated protease RseP (regulator of RpoE activity)
VSFLAAIPAWVGSVFFILAIIVVIIVHESGHFFVAKAFRIKVEEFFVGFGPRLWSVRRGETEYGVKALPFGGYVRIAGMNPFQEPTPQEYPRTFGAKPIWQRAAVILAGPITHFLMAVVLFAVFFSAIGIQARYFPVINRVEPTLNGQPSPASVAGLQAGDVVIAYDGISVRATDDFNVTGNDFRDYTRSHVDRPIRVTVRRDGRTLTVTATPVLTNVEGMQAGRLGIVLGAESTARRRANPITAVGRGVIQTGQTTKEVVLQLGHVFGPAAVKRIGELVFGGAERSTSDPTSIIGVGQLAGQAVQQGAWDLLFYLMVVFNVFVGILNLVPLPPLDGGHLAVLAYEKIRRRRPDPRKLIPLTTIVAGFIVLYALAVSYLDIVKPIPSPFR